MLIDDFGGPHEVHSLDELQALLQRRYEGGYNGFWLSDPAHGKALSVLVKGELSYLHYFPQEKSHPGFHSVGETIVPNEGEEGLTIFRAESLEQEQAIINGAIVPFTQALAAAEPFFADPNKLPSAVRWEEL